MFVVVVLGRNSLAALYSEELSHFLALPSYQLALPFSQEAWRHLTYAQMLTGTHS